MPPPTDYQEAFDAILVPATLIDAAGVIVDYNRAFHEYARTQGRELDKAERIGRHVTEFVFPDADGRRFTAFIATLLADGADSDMLESMRGDTGRLVHTRVQARCIVRDGKVQGAVLLREDVTQRVQQEQRVALTQELRDAVWRMRAADDMEHILVAVRDGLLRFGIPFNDCGVNIVDAHAGSVRFHNMRADGEWHESHPEEGTETVLDIWRKKEIAYRRDLQAHDAFDEGPSIQTIFGHPVRSVVDLPFSRGTLAVNSIEANAFTETDLDILAAMARVLSEGFDRVADLEALRRSEERYRATVSQVADAMLFVDLQTLEILETNPACDQLLGYDAGELAGSPVTNIAAQDLQMVEADARNVLDGGELTGDRQLRRRNGSLVDTEVRVSRIVYGGREVACAVVRDMTERKRAERRRTALQGLREEVWRMRTGQEIDSLLEQARLSLRSMGVDFDHFGINLVDPERHTPVRAFTDIQRRLRWPGASRESQLASVVTWWREGKPVYRPDLQTEDLFGERDIIDKGYGQSIRSVLDVPFSHGTVAINSLRPDAFDDDDVASVQELAGALSEGFQRTDDLRHLAQQREYLAVTLRSIGDGVIATDAAGRVQLVNEAAERLLGWSQAEAQNRPLGEVFSLLDEDTRQACESPVNRVMRDGLTGPSGQRTVLVARDGTERLVEDRGAPIRDEDDQIIGVVLVFQDATAAREAERERERSERLESLGVLAGGIAHDFNNILTGISGNLSLARLEAGDTEPLAPLLTSAEAAAQRAARLTAQLLTFARGGVPARRSVRLDDLVIEAADFALRGSNVRSSYELAADLWPIHADPDQLSQVVQNLVINANQAMETGGTIYLSAVNVTGPDMAEATSDTSQRRVRLQIRDEGPGIDASVRDRIFEPYFTTKESGSGLGLATVYSIIDQHEGTIQLDSVTGEGTTFTIELPASSEPATSVAGADQPLPKGRGQRVLVMDDESAVIGMLDQALKGLGYDAVFAEDGSAALAACRQALAAGQPFAAVILDLTVPGGMGGVQALEQLSALDPRLRAIVSSGYSNDPVLADHKRYGFHGTLPKPYRIHELAAILADVMAADAEPS